MWIYLKNRPIHTDRAPQKKRTCHARASRRVLCLKPVILQIRLKLYVRNNLTLQTNMHFLG